MTETQIANLAISHLGGKPLTALSTDTTAQAVAARKWFDPARDEALRSHPWNFARKRDRLTTSYVDITGAADNGAGLVRITSAAHGLSNGMRVYIKDVGGVTAANGRWYVEGVTTNTFDLTDSVFAGTYTSSTGSWVRVPLFGWDFWHTQPADCLRILRCNGNDGATDDGEEFEIEEGKILIDSATVELAYIYRNEDTTDWTQDFINAFSLLLASYMAEDLTGGRSETLRESYQKLLLPQARTQDAKESKPRTPPAFYEGSYLYASRLGSTAP